MSITPPVINTTPKGLLSLLGIKNGGSNPQSLAGFVQPTADLLSWYCHSIADEYGFSAPAAAGFAGALSFANQTSGPPFPGGPAVPPGAIPAGVFVPQNEVWVVLRWNIGWASVGPNSDWCMIDVGLTALGHEFFPAQSTCDVTPIPGATTYSRSRACIELPLILFGGAEMKLSVQNVQTAGGKVFSSAARIARLTL